MTRKKLGTEVISMAKTQVCNSIDEAVRLVGEAENVHIRSSTVRWSSINVCGLLESKWHSENPYGILHVHFCLTQFEQIRPMLKLSATNVAALLLALAYAWALPLKRQDSATWAQAQVDHLIDNARPAFSRLVHDHVLVVRGKKLPETESERVIARIGLVGDGRRLKMLGVE